MTIPQYKKCSQWSFVAIYICFIAYLVGVYLHWPQSVTMALCVAEILYLFLYIYTSKKYRKLLRKKSIKDLQIMRQAYEKLFGGDKNV